MLFWELWKELFATKKMFLYLGHETSYCLCPPLAQKVHDGAVKTEWDWEIKQLGCKRHSPSKWYFRYILVEKAILVQLSLKSCALLQKQEEEKCLKKKKNNCQLCCLVVMSRSGVSGVTSMLMKSTSDCN